MGQSPNARADQVLEDRLVAASRTLDHSGYIGEVLDLYVRYRDNRWRLLVEYLELMRKSGFPEDEVMFIQDLRRS